METPTPGTWGAPNLPSGRDDFTGKQLPVVRSVDDLSGFVMLRIGFEESAPKLDVPQVYSQPAGPIAHRYAAAMRSDMQAFRRVVAQYVEAVAAVEAASDDYEHQVEEDRALGLRQAVAAIAMRWDQHPDFHEEWRV